MSVDNQFEADDDLHETPAIEGNELVPNSPKQALPKHKDNNPFTKNLPELPGMEIELQVTYTDIQPDVLVKYPFKTINRIVDDIKYTTLFKRKHHRSLLNSKPITYSSDLSKLLNIGVHREYELLTLNNLLTFAPSTETIKLAESNHHLTVIRALLVNRSLHEINHVKILILEKKPSQFATNLIDKHQYHIIPRSLISEDDLHALEDESVNSPNLVDDSFFKSLNGPNNHILRVSIYSNEFEPEDLLPITDEKTIKSRYLDTIASHNENNLSPDTIPTPIHCFQTLIKVLKGPINLPADHPIQTINIKNTSLDAKLDVDLLFNRLSFTSSGDDLVPPNLSLNPSLRQSYIRKILELIYVGKLVKVSNQVNGFDTQYSFSDNCSLIYRTFNEVDKHVSLSLGRNHNSNQLAFFTNLSSCTYFQDELIIKCFECTVQSDPVNQPHYVDSLKSIIQFKSNQPSNKLKTYFNNASSKGEMVGYTDYTNALKSIGIELTSDSIDIDDDFIVAMYITAFKSDTKNYSYFNKGLKVIAKVRNSEFLRNYLDKEILPMNLALEELSIEEITEDEVVITAFEFRLDEVLQANNFRITNEVTFLYKCLLSVAVIRKSYILMNYIETKYPQVLGNTKDISFTEALDKLGVTLLSNDFEIIAAFQEKLTQSQIDPLVNSGSDDIRVLRQCLKEIAVAKNSKILLSFLNSGKIDSSLLPAENWPAGLDNIGNTCYLNSLLQYYFCLKPLRDAVLNFNELNIDYTKHPERKIGGRKAEELEIVRSCQFIYHLKNLFHEMIYTNKRCVQPSKELAYLSFLPLSQPVEFKELIKTEENEVIEILDEDDVQLSKTVSDEDVEMIEDLSKEVVEEVSSDGEDTPSSSIEDDVEISPLKREDAGSESDSKDVENVFDSRIDVDDALDNKEMDVEPKLLLISTDQMESTIEVGRQQDVTECIENVTFQIETASDPESIDSDGEQYDLIKKLFYGKTKQTIIPLDSENKKPRISIERFFSLIINVSDHPKDIYDSLDNYFSEDLVNLEEGLVKKSITIQELPEVLQFHVQRVMFDRERLMAYKSIEPIPFSEQIYLDRYLDTEDEEILNKRLEVFKWKSEMKQLHESKDAILQVDPDTNLTIIDNLYATKKFLEQKIANHETLSIKAETIFALQDQIDLLKDELQLIHEKLRELQTKVSNQFVDYNKVGYSIFAIFIHRGEASYGHYWVYIKDPHKNIFRKYNDETVTEVPASEVFNFSEGNTATPYYIVYIKDTLMKQYVEPLKRVVNKC